MSVPPESIQIGQCYVSAAGEVRRVLGLLPKRVQFQQRAGHRRGWDVSIIDSLDRRSFAFAARKPVPCDWTPEADEAKS